MGVGVFGGCHGIVTACINILSFQLCPMCIFFTGGLCNHRNRWSSFMCN